MRERDRHLKRRGKRWHYVRRVPAHVAHLDDRPRIEASLKTTNLDVARIRRDALEESDELYWASLVMEGEGGAGPRQQIARRYEAARARALVLGFTYRSASALADDAPLDELIRRVEVLETTPATTRARDVEALLGGAAEPTVPVSEALDKYIAEIAPVGLMGKSAKQRASWEKVKRRAVANFTNLVGDRAIEQITREDALKFYDWWRDRVTGKSGGKPLSGNSANRDIGNMRVLVREHFKRLGQEDRPNPFRGLHFTDPKTGRRNVPPFPTQWIADRILRPAAFEGLNQDAALIVLTLIETGCRPSEICNLVPSAIRLDDEVPHLAIDFRPDRAIKTESSVRSIPLVGVSLEAMRHAPQGFARYMDKEDSLSATLMKHFKKRQLFPTAGHVIYSFRHAFEKRMLEAKIDPELRRLMMGHTIDRPEYGDGGSLAFRRDQLNRITLPFDAGLLKAICKGGGDQRRRSRPAPVKSGSGQP